MTIIFFLIEKYNKDWFCIVLSCTLFNPEEDLRKMHTFILSILNVKRAEHIYDGSGSVSLVVSFRFRYSK